MVVCVTASVFAGCSSDGAQAKSSDEPAAPGKNVGTETSFDASESPRWAFADKDFFQSYQLAGEERGWGAADTFANGLENGEAIDLAGAGKVRIIGREPFDDATDVCNVQIKDADETAWTSCTILDERITASATPQPYGKRGIVDANWVDREGNGDIVLVANPADLCRMEDALAEKKVGNGIPAGAVIVADDHKPRARLLQSKIAYSCTDGQVLDANRVVLLQGLGKGRSGWVDTYADDATALHVRKALGLRQ